MNLEKKLEAISPQEQQIISLKYQSKKIGQMSAAEVSSWSKALLLKIHVITGWTIQEKEFMKILTDQFEKKLVENYGDMNPDEIEFAFRSTGTTIEDWGKSMNLNLLDKVLLPYLENRFELSKVEEKLKQKPEQRIYTPEETLNLHRAETEKCYQRFLSGNTNYFPEAIMKEVLEIDGFNTGEDLKKFFEQKALAGFKNLYQPQ